MNPNTKKTLLMSSPPMIQKLNNLEMVVIYYITSSVKAYYNEGSLTVTIILYAILILLSFLALWLPPFRARGLIFSSIIAILLYIAQHDPFPQEPSTRFSLAMLWFIYLGTIEKILFTIPEKVYWRNGKALQEGLYMKAFGLEKARWALELMTNMRGVGWNFQVKGVSAGLPNESRLHFLLRQGRDIGIGLIILNACSKILVSSRYPPGLDVQDLKLPFWVRIGLILTIGIQSYFANHFNYQVLSIIAVATRLSEPKDWPPLFGLISTTYTVRNFWGTFWHQAIRKILSGYSQFLLRLFRVPRHTIASSIFTLIFTFLLSGLYHGYASYSLPFPTTTSPYATTFDRFGRFLVFFLVQPIGIVVEDVVTKAYGRYVKASTKDKEAYRHNLMWHRMIGYCWTLCWMLLSGNLLVDTYLKTEMGLVGASMQSK